MRKINILLKAFEHARKNVEYFALDLSLSELERTFSEISVKDYHYVSIFGLHGTYEDGLAWLAESVSPLKPTCVLSLGSSIGNFSREEAAKFLASFVDVLGPADRLLIGLDACQDPERVYRAYNDSEDLTQLFYRNGLDHANKLLGFEAFQQQDWGVVGTYDAVRGRHEAFYQALKDVSIAKMTFTKGDRLKLEDAYKYSSAQSDALWQNAGLVQQTAYANKQGDYREYICSNTLSPWNSQAGFQPVPSVYIKSGFDETLIGHLIWLNY